MKPHEDDWLARGACRKVETELFYPHTDKADSAQFYAEAKPVCQACPVRPQCLEYALANNEQGMWGGTTERERRIIKRRRKAAS